MTVKIYSPAGANPEVTTTDAEFGLGDVAVGENNSEWLYVQANGAITGDGYTCLIDETYQADMVETTNSATGFGQKCGVPKVAFADNDYGWVQVKGVANVRVAASAAANTALNSTATAGQIDDDATVGAEVIDGLVLTTANGGAAATAAGLLNWPSVGATL